MKDLVMVALELQRLSVTQCCQQLFFGSEKTELYNNVVRGAVFSTRCQSAMILSISSRYIGIDGASSWNNAVMVDCRSVTVSGGCHGNCDPAAGWGSMAIGLYNRGSHGALSQRALLGRLRACAPPPIFYILTKIGY